jgi:hypothetical protein
MIGVGGSGVKVALLSMIQPGSFRSAPARSKITAVTTRFDPAHLLVAKFVSVNIQVTVHPVFCQRVVKMPNSVESAPLTSPMVDVQDS